MRKAKTTRINLLLLATPTVIVIIMSATLFWFFDQMKSANDHRNRELAVRENAQILLMDMLGAETATRGFFLAGNEEFLEPYRDAQNDIPERIKKLHELTTTPVAKKQLEVIVQLVANKMARLNDSIEIKRNGDFQALVKRVQGGEGQRVMDALRKEFKVFRDIENAELKVYDDKIRLNMNLLFAFIICVSVLMLLFAQAFAYGIYRNIHQRLMALVHVETKRTLDIQEAMNQQLNIAFASLKDNEKKLEVTLNSIADAVIATDRDECITLMNSVAEHLTGWTQLQAMGRPIHDIFRIINKDTREPMHAPVAEVLSQGAAQSANHTILTLSDGTERYISDSCAPIRDHDGQVIGAVLVFRDITAENAAQLALRDSTELVQNILGTVVDGIVTFRASTNIIETVNSAAEKMFGYSAEELVGKKFSTIVPELTEEQASLDYYAASVDERASGLVREVTGLVKDGQTFPMEITVSEMRLGGERYFTGVLRNITSRKNAERNIRESEDRYRNLFETIDEGFCVAEMIYENGNPVDHLFLEVNPSFEKQSGFHAAQGKRLRDFVPNIEASWFKPYHEVLQSGEPQRFEAEVKAMRRWFDVYVCRLGGDGSTKMAVLFTDVTERKHFEDALLESEELIRLATEATGVGIWEWNLLNNTVRWDAQMYRIYGVTPTDDGTIHLDDWQNYLLPEDQRPTDSLQTIIAERKKSTREFRIKREGEDSIRYIRSVETMRTNAQGEVESIVGTNLDITELKRTEQILRDSERHLRSVIDALPVAIFTTDENGILTHFNQAAVDFSGRTPRLGTDSWCISSKLFHTDGSPMPHDQSPMAISLKEGRQTLGAEAIAERPDGTRVFFTAHPTPLHDADGKLIGGINMLIDITERRRLDQVLQENNIELKKAKFLAEKANLAKSDFLSNMSHELRTPLSAILGFAQLIDGGNPPPTPSQKRSVDQILQAGWYLLDLINEILDLTLIESGKLSLSIESVSIVELMHEAKTMIEPQALNRDISLHFPEFDQVYLVKADHMRLKQVLINLLSNAVKYNRNGGKVIVTCFECSPGRLRICVEDTGEGLSPLKLSQLFQPFNRLGKEASAEEGTGIGLVMTKRLIELMGGKINVESTVGEGTVFWVDLDISTPALETDNTDSTSIKINIDHAKDGVAKRTLLYVEDNPANLMLVEDIIDRRSDISLLTAREGYSGIELARIAQPDLILMDINLPGINGTEVLHILAKDPATMHIPIIALSANALPRDIEKGLESGFFRYLTKPIKINEFMDALDMALDFSAKKPLKVAEEKRVES